MSNRRRCSRCGSSTENSILCDECWERHRTDGEVLCEVNGIPVLVEDADGELRAPEGLEGIAAYFRAGGTPEAYLDRRGVFPARSAALDFMSTLATLGRNPIVEFGVSEDGEPRVRIDIANPASTVRHPVHDAREWEAWKHALLRAALKVNAPEDPEAKVDLSGGDREL